MKRIKVYDANTEPVCVNSGWIVLSAVFFVLTVLMACVAVRNAKMIDCVHVYPENDGWYCITEVEGV